MFTQRMVGFCLLSAALVAAAVYSYPGSPDFSAAFGAATRSGCKGPCSDGGTPMRVDECLDESGPPCNTKYCTANYIRSASCPAGDPVGDEQPCKMHTDSGDWWRQAIIKKPSTSCVIDAKDKGKYHWDAPACTYLSGDLNWVETPCKDASACEGVEQIKIDYPGRERCGD